MYLSLENEMWEKQIGSKKVGRDFSGREIHKDSYGDYSSPFGWSVISFDNETHLVVHVETEKEFPDKITHSEEDEFFINGKFFNVSKNEDGNWDINLVQYEQEAMNLSLDNDHEEYESNYDYEESHDDVFQFDNNSYNETQAFSFKNNDYEQNNNDILIKKQKQQIEELENQLKIEREKTQLLEIEKNNERLRHLEEQIKTSASLNLNKSRGNEYNESTQLSEINEEDFFSAKDNLSSTRSINRNLGSSFISNEKRNSNNNGLLNDLMKKLNEQTAQINSLRIEQKNSQKKLQEIEKNKSSFINKTRDVNVMKQTQSIKVENDLIGKMWELEFGSNSFGIDFSGKIISREKYGKKEEGGWDLDFYDSNSGETFIASYETIKERAGKSSFTINDFSYHITKNGNKWEIIKTKKGQIFEYSSKNFTNIASNIKPDENTKFSGKYESYSSILLSLNHFPLIHLDKFELFIKKSLSNLPFFKEMYIYSNERLYKDNKSDISAYARIFFKTSSTKDDIEILLTSLSLKNGTIKFIDNFKSTNKLDSLSFSMVLMSHQRRLKFVHAQTNFELLKAHPIPSKIPQEKLIIDKEYNSILKFHENNLWKQLRPLAIDWNGNVYYVCDIDVDSIDISFQHN